VNVEAYEFESLKLPCESDGYPAPELIVQKVKSFRQMKYY